MRHPLTRLLAWMAGPPDIPRDVVLRALTGPAKAVYVPPAMLTTAHYPGYEVIADDHLTTTIVGVDRS